MVQNKLAVDESFYLNFFPIWTFGGVYIYGYEMGAPVFAHLHELLSFKFSKAEMFFFYIQYSAQMFLPSHDECKLFQRRRVCYLRMK